MKKILIADDEFLVRLGLRTTINWEQNGLQVVGEANNGKEALELFEKYNPDILLTDIRMPIISGLELIQILKERKKVFKAVILTHCDDFGYAQEAIKLGASEYILKTDLTADNLLSVLKKLTQEIEDIEEVPSNNIDIKRNNDENANRELLLEKIVIGKIKSKENLEQQLTAFPEMFKYDSFVFVTGIIENINHTSYEKGEDLFVKTIKNVSKMVFDGMDLMKISFINKKGITYLINLKTSENSGEVLENLLGYMKLLKKNLKQFLNIDLSIGISEINNSAVKLLELFEQSLIAQRYCFFDPSSIVVFNENLINKEGIYPKVNLELLKGWVKTLEVQQLEIYINSIFKQLFDARQIEHIKDVFYDFLSFAKIITKELNLENGPALSEAKFSYSNFDKLNSIEAVRQYVINVYISMIDYSSDNKSGRYSFIISKCINFIRQNYQKNITLSDAADNVEISKSYLSLLFKQETGINFSIFLTNYRIEMSKKLLLESNMKIYEIAEKVGFDNPYYFSKVFRDIAGTTCKEFKKNNISKFS